MNSSFLFFVFPFLPFWSSYYTYDCTLSCSVFHSTVLLSLTRGPLVVIMITERNIVSSFLLSPLVPKYPPLARFFLAASVDHQYFVFPPIFSSLPLLYHADVVAKKLLTMQEFHHGLVN
ncbi:hypothetical protein BO83DRAFT_30094 [Aspergillus eucalypticola CBS 122712]|uniref:Uncharacterized protein n=1 Tax=Aspergillus eucalypticola (strain CBS 122712 / IBT 29274) TaxID=1448314 RepID=A0A317VFY5_ASPEC|nr:uncharacterized protein BO83DRAFT_30094 [Aspergillus eucalypticola CBS 122712]PWY73276.1 hypothetical protein BO83DRAFT_30094 [Aspergillus eucalypticola CBS 122712]